MEQEAKKSYIPQTPISVSITDLLLAKDTIEEMGINYVLDAIGFDVTQPIERNVLTHRNRQGDIVTAELISGIERSDEIWLKCDLASDDVKMAVRNDVSYNREIHNLSKRASL